MSPAGSRIHPPRRVVLHMTKKRLDILLVERALADSREIAQRLVRAGQVKVDGHVFSKPGHRFDESCRLSVKKGPRFVGRGGEKLERAFSTFDLDVHGRVCIDIGSSTGGFTDCLLQHGAARVWAVDVGKGQLEWKLRNDPRVNVLEGVNARYLSDESLPERPTFATVDVSFISLTKILPAVIQVLGPQAQIVTLVKPQFEAGRRYVARGGVVRDESVRREVLSSIRTFGEQDIGLKWLGCCESPPRGPAGNVEYLVHWAT